MKNREECLGLAMLIAATIFCPAPAKAQNQPFKLNVEERGYIQDPSGGQYQYPTPQYVPAPTLQGNVDQQRRPKPPTKKLKGGAQDSAPPPRPPMQMRVQQSVALPPGFMGAWQVNGLRQNIECPQPQFAAVVPTIFAENTQDIWTITGDPKSGYGFSNTMGVRSAIFVDKVQGDTAFIRYQHPIKNTMAQEAIVMQLSPGGAQFSGLERISIVKQGEPTPRAKVTYQLMGSRTGR